MSILQDYIITKRFLFPRKKDVENPYFIYADGNKLSCIRHINFEDAKMLIVFHAGNELVEDYADTFADEIKKMGINLLLVEYPGYSMSGGESDIVNILDTVPDIIKNCGVSPENIIVFGRSIGAAYAVEAVAKYPNISGLIIESGAADFYKRINRRVTSDDLDCTEEELKQEILKYFDTEKKLATYKGGTLIMHAGEDRIIEAEQALMNYSWVKQPKMLKLFDLCTHKDLQYSNKKEYFRTIFNFIENLK